jgi:hypothetical protein
MQFSSFIFALFAGVAFAAPSQIEERQNTQVGNFIHSKSAKSSNKDIQCNLCREECFFLKGPFEPCLDRCNKDLDCNLTP